MDGKRYVGTVVDEDNNEFYTVHAIFHDTSSQVDFSVSQYDNQGVMVSSASGPRFTRHLEYGAY